MLFNSFKKSFSFEFEDFRTKVKVTVTIYRKYCHHSSAFIYRLIMIKFHTNVKYDNILDKFELESSKVKVTVAIFKKTLCHHSSAFIYRPILILYHTIV